jgi:hypothetical protein
MLGQIQVQGQGQIQGQIQGQVQIQGQIQGQGQGQTIEEPTTNEIDFKNLVIKKV